ncbi:hypothetical protein DO72_4916 [Burkholderia pseudomallei]|nr:hypothetical protein DO72_4916 [Burkholderia pseudomallei]
MVCLTSARRCGYGRRDVYNANLICNWMDFKKIDRDCEFPLSRGVFARARARCSRNALERLGNRFVSSFHEGEGFRE